MPWVPLDIHWGDDPKIEAAAEQTPFALSAFPMLLAAAKARADGGRVELTYRKLATKLFISETDTAEAVEALVSAGVLTCESQDDRAVVVKFPAWRRWNERARKAAERERRAA